MLEHHAAVMAAPRHPRAVDFHASAGGVIKAHGDAQRRGLAASARPDQGDDLAVFGFHAEAVERAHHPGLASDPQGKVARDLDQADAAHAGLLARACGRFGANDVVGDFESSIGFFSRPALTSSICIQSILSSGFQLGVDVLVAQDFVIDEGRARIVGLGAGDLEGELQRLVAVRHRMPQSLHRAARERSGVVAASASTLPVVTRQTRMNSA